MQAAARAAERQLAKAPRCQSGFQGPPLSDTEARLWLQAYNAGPYALLRHRGSVPYRETRQYVPRVLRYYREDLSGTPFEKHIQVSCAKYGLDPQFVRAIMKAESDFRTRCVSSAGARGLMQVMPCVWSEIKRRYSLTWVYHTEVFDPEKNIEVACAYLAWLKYEFLPAHFSDFGAERPKPQGLIADKDLDPPRRRIATDRTKVANTASVRIGKTITAVLDSSQVVECLRSTGPVDSIQTAQRTVERVVSAAKIDFNKLAEMLAEQSADSKKPRSVAQKRRPTGHNQRGRRSQSI